MRLSGKIAIVTGGSAGIGAATVEKFLAEGATVHVWDIHNLQVTIPQTSQQFYHSVDVTNQASVKSAVENVLQQSGRIDILVNNAGITADAQLVKWKNGEVASTLTEDSFDKVLNVNLKGVFNCTQAVTPVMIKQGGGVIINVSSVVGLYGNFGQTNYAATKAGVIGMTKTWSRELGRYGIRVNAVAPGFILTDMVKKMPADVLEEMKKHTPLGRLGTPEEVASLYAFLSSDEASYIHGAVISIDGGIIIGT